MLIFAGSASADNVPPLARGSKEEAVAMVQRAVEYYKSNGAEKAFAEFSNPQGRFIDRDLYIVAYDLNGVCLAHGANKKLVNRNRLDEQDVDGKYYIRERVELMKTHESFWMSYQFTDPLTHKIMPKLVYCQTVHDPALNTLSMCVGVYGL